MKTEQRLQARRLRAQGRSVKEVAEIVGVSVSSVSRWVRDVELNARARSCLLARNPAHNGEVALSSDYAAAWAEWSRSGESDVWNAATADGQPSR